MYHAGMFNLENWDSSVRYAVYDDIAWEYFPSKKQLLGSQREFSIADKYRRKRTVTYSMPWIFTMNQDNWSKVEKDDMYQWLMENAKVVFISRKLY